MEYDRKCRQCDSGVIVKGDQEETCDTCDGYGSLLTESGRLLLEFLSRRGFATPMSPRAEEELQGMVE